MPAERLRKLMTDLRELRVKVQLALFHLVQHTEARPRLRHVARFIASQAFWCLIAEISDIAACPHASDQVSLICATKRILPVLGKRRMRGGGARELLGCAALNTAALTAGIRSQGSGSRRHRRHRRRCPGSFCSRPYSISSAVALAPLSSGANPASPMTQHAPANPATSLCAALTRPQLFADPPLSLLLSQNQPNTGYPASCGCLILRLSEGVPDRPPGGGRGAQQVTPGWKGLLMAEAQYAKCGSQPGGGPPQRGGIFLFNQQT